MNGEHCNQQTKPGPRHPRAKFSPMEDQRILELVERFGDQNWALIASMIKGRSTRQCRERYVNYLCPDVNTSPWTHEEDELLYLKKEAYGAHWKTISGFFKNRTDINVKNRWLKLERQKAKQIRKEKKAAEKASVIEFNTFVQCNDYQTNDMCCDFSSTIFDFQDFGKETDNIAKLVPIID